MKSSLAVFRKRLKTLSKPIIFQFVLESMEISITVQNIEPSKTLPKKLKDIANKVEHSASSFKPSIPFHSLYNMVDECHDPLPVGISLAAEEYRNSREEKDTAELRNIK